MIAGLMSNSSTNTIEKTPGAGDLPILGSLFRSTNFRKGETELVIVVTPYLVKPVNANDIKLPTDGYQAPNELERLFGNMEAGGESGKDRPKPSAAPAPKDAVTAPQVGVLDPQASPGSKPRKQKNDRKRNASNTPAPGFSLN